MLTKIRRDITLEDISNMRDECFDLSDFSIDYHEMGCHENDTINYTGNETDEQLIKLWCLAIVTTGYFTHNYCYCQISDNYKSLFDDDDDDELLDEAWKIAVKKGLTYDNFGDAIRQLGYIPGQAEPTAVSTVTKPRQVVKVNHDDYSIASSILLELVDIIHVKECEVMVIEFDGDDKLVKQFNQLMCAAHESIKNVSN